MKLSTRSEIRCELILRSVFIARVVSQKLSEFHKETSQIRFSMRLLYTHSFFFFTLRFKESLYYTDLYRRVKA